MLELKNIRFAYPGMTPPYDFSMQVQASEIVLVSGRSGSGKSTLLDLIAGFQTPSDGMLTLYGADLLPRPPEARPVSILFQKDNLFDHLTVAENLALGVPKGTPKPDARRDVEAALEQVSLPEYADRRASNLSGGQQQRVALARTLLRNRPVLLLDEPFANLDTETAAEMRDLVRSLTRKAQWHTIIVSHLSADAEQLADRTYSLEAASLSA